MVSAFTDWIASFAYTPLLLVAASIALLVWLVAIITIMRRAEGSGLRSALFISATLYFCALLAFVNPPMLSRVSGSATLITAGATADALAAIEPGTDVYVIDEAWPESVVQAFIDARFGRRDTGRLVRVASVDAVQTYQADLARLLVVGDGLSRSAWQSSLFTGEVVYTPRPLDAGIADLSFATRVPIGEALTVDVRTTKGEPPAGLVLSVHAEDGRELAQRDVGAELVTQLVVTSLAPGRQVLSLRLTDAQSESIVETVSLPVEVVRPPLARLLMLQAAPAFEWRALWRWASDSGASVAARITISKDRTRIRVSDDFDVDPRLITQEMLGRVDLVIADGATLNKLSDVERAALFSPDHGAGVLLLIHDADDFASLPPAIADVLTRSGNADRIYRLPEMGLTVESGLSREALEFAEDAVAPLLRDDLGGVIAARVLTMPNIALSLLRDSYRLVGAGEAAVHARVWSRLTEALARPVSTRVPRFDHAVSRVAERLRMCWPGTVNLSEVELRHVKTGTQHLIGLHKVASRPGEVCGWFWPMRAGWWQVREAEAGVLASHYVSGDDDRRTQRATERMTATQLRAAVPAVAGSVLEMRRQTPMPRDWPLIALLLFSTTAWLIQRLSVARRRR